MCQGAGKVGFLMKPGPCFSRKIFKIWTKYIFDSLPNIYKINSLKQVLSKCHNTTKNAEYILICQNVLDIFLSNYKYQHNKDILNVLGLKQFD